jgi:hypothetical protein
VPNSYGLQAVGVSARWILSRQLILDGIGAATVGGNPGRIDGYDADGKRRNIRAWLRATTAF